MTDTTTTTTTDIDAAREWQRFDTHAIQAADYAERATHQADPTQAANLLSAAGIHKDLAMACVPPTRLTDFATVTVGD